MNMELHFVNKKSLVEELDSLEKRERKRVVSLKNALKGMVVTEEDLKNARQSVFPLSSQR